MTNNEKIAYLMDQIKTYEADNTMLTPEDFIEYGANMRMLDEFNRENSHEENYYETDTPSLLITKLYFHDRLDKSGEMKDLIGLKAVSRSVEGRKIVDAISIKVLPLFLFRQDKISYSFTKELTQVLDEQAEDLKNEEIYISEIVKKLPSKNFFVTCDNVFKKRWQKSLIRKFGGNYAEFDKETTELLGFQFYLDEVLEGRTFIQINVIFKWKNPDNMYVDPTKGLTSTSHDFGKPVDDLMVFPFFWEIFDKPFVISDTNNGFFTDAKGYEEFDRKFRTDVMARCLSYILYLSSINAEVEEKVYHPANKKDKTAKKISKVKNFSCGEGFAIRSRAFKMGGAGITGGESGTGSVKAPHIRRAHWHRYWKGKRTSDKRELIMRWVEPCYIHKEMFVNSKPVNVRVS